MANAIEEKFSQCFTPKTTSYETTLKLIKGRVITLNFDLVSGDSSSISSDSFDELIIDQLITDPVKLNIKKCFVHHKSSKLSNSSATETSEHVLEETTANISNVASTSVDKIVSMSGATLATESSVTTELETDDLIQENALLKVANPSANRFVLPKMKKAPSHRVTEKTLICAVCKRGFVLKMPYEKHLLTHIGNKCDNLFKCDFCGKGFLKKYNVIKHFKKVHMPSKILKCGDCPKFFRSRSGLSDHKRAHHGPKDQMLSCPTCGKIFTHKKSLKIHLETFPEHGGSTSSWI